MLAKNGLLKVKEISEFLNNETLFTSLNKTKIQITSYSVLNWEADYNQVSKRFSNTPEKDSSIHLMYH